MQMKVLYEFRLAKYYMYLSLHLNHLPEACEMKKEYFVHYEGAIRSQHQYISLVKLIFKCHVTIISKCQF